MVYTPCFLPMLIRFFHVAFFFLAIAGYTGDAIICYEERMESHCSDDHTNSTQSSHQECQSCVCHMPADVSHESNGTVLLFDEVKTVKKEHSPTYCLVIPPDLQPPRLS